MNNKITCAVIDDEPLAIKLLVNYIHLSSELELKFETTKALTFTEFLKTDTVDLVFLDIQMPEISGLDLGRTFGRKTKIIMTTAFQEYAIDGYDMDVVDFLLKPISFERFRQSVEKLVERISSRKDDIAKRDHLFIKVEHKNVKIMLDDIIYIEGLRDYLMVHTKKEKLMTLDSIKNFETLLPGNFYRIHKSYLINTNHIQQIERNMIQIGDKHLPIGDTYKEKFLAFLGLQK